MRKIWILAVIIAIGVAVYLRQSADQPVEQTAEDTPSTALVSIVLPGSLPAQATTGKTIFEARKKTCHTRFQSQFLQSSSLNLPVFEANF